jgi:putative peptide zinc metalloprotease protein
VVGFVEPVRMAVIYPGADGFLQQYLPSGVMVSPDGPPLAVLENPDLVAQKKAWLAEKSSLEGQRDVLRARQDLPSADAKQEQIAAADIKIGRLKEQLANLQVRSPLEGRFLAPQLDRLRGAYIDRHHQVGVVATLDDLHVRAMAGQDVVGLLLAEGAQGPGRIVEMRVDGRPDTTFPGTIKQILPMGQEKLPSAALGYAGGGSIAVSAEDKQGTKASEHLFEIQITPEPAEGDKAVRLLAGQRVVIQFSNERKPLLAQWWRSLLQLIPRRFKV